MRSSIVETILRSSGWFPGRREPLGDSHLIYPADHPGRAVMEEFGELTFEGAHLCIYILEPRAKKRLLAAIEKSNTALGTTMVCVGIIDGMEYIFLTSDGAVFAEDCGRVYYWADSFSNFLERALVSGIPAQPAGSYPTEVVIE